MATPPAQPHARRIATIELTAGPTWTRIDGPAEGAPILLIHGATVPHWEFDGLVPVLARAGYRVLRFDLYGHGRSARPATRYDRALFVGQAEALLDHVRWPASKLTVLGHSMGAAIAADLAGRRAIGKLILLAPMLDFSATNPFGPILRSPILGEAFMATVGRPGLLKRRRTRYGAIGRPDLARRFRAQSGRAGFWRAMLRMERDGALGNQAEAYRRAAARSPRTLILRGVEDAIIPVEDTDRIARMFPGGRRIDLERLAHNLMLVDPDRVGRHILEFLAATPCPHGETAKQGDGSAAF